MTLTEMIDNVIERGGNGRHVLNMLIEFGHVPPDADTRPAEMTSSQCAAFDVLTQSVKTLTDIIGTMVALGALEEDDDDDPITDKEILK